VGKNKIHHFWSPIGKPLEKSTSGPSLEKILATPIGINLLRRNQGKWEVVLRKPNNQVIFYFRVQQFYMYYFQLKVSGLLSCSTFYI